MINTIRKIIAEKFLLYALKLYPGGPDRDRLSEFLTFWDYLEPLKEKYKCLKNKRKMTTSNGSIRMKTKEYLMCIMILLLTAILYFTLLGLSNQKILLKATQTINKPCDRTHMFTQTNDRSVQLDNRERCYKFHNPGDKCEICK